MKNLVEKWQKDYRTMKATLSSSTWDLSKPKDLIEYNLICVQAMQLAECIMELQDAD